MEKVGKSKQESEVTTDEKTHDEVKSGEDGKKASEATNLFSHLGVPGRLARFVSIVNINVVHVVKPKLFHLHTTNASSGLRRVAKGRAHGYMVQCQ